MQDIHTLSKRLIVKQALFIVCATLPVVLFTFQFAILSHNRAFGYDWDYFAQVYEAARKCILQYHQFPWWNPWSIGGVPLYANPQFGLTSIQMALVLLFGTLTGLHLAVMCYFVIGFWGMYLLIRRAFGQSVGIALPLAYIWTFSGFPVAHLLVGHLTFATYLLAPWFFLALSTIHHKRGWLWLGLLSGWLIEQSPHYVTIELLAIGGAIALVDIARRFRSSESRGSVIKPYLLAGTVALPLAAPKLFFTLQYLHEFPRLTPPDNPVSPLVLVSALIDRSYTLIASTFHTQWAWWEYASYIGLVCAAAFIYLVARLILKDRNKSIGLLILLAAAVVFCLAIGPFAPFSPYSLMHHLPVFNQMRVPSRWIGWVSFGIVVFLARLPNRLFVKAALAVAIIEVFTASFPILNAYQAAYVNNHGARAVIAQRELVASAAPLPLFSATRDNTDSVYGYEPILGFYGDNSRGYTAMSHRCGEESGCGLVLTHNAYVQYWSPLTIVIKRVAAGNVCLDMNPGKNWAVNGRRDFAQYRVLELQKDFCFDDASPLITLHYTPTL